MSTQVKCNDWFEIAVCGFLFAPHTLWALICDRLATKRHLSLFLKLSTLIDNFQGQHRSNLKTDLNSQHTVSYLLHIHTLALISDRLAPKINLPFTVVSKNGWPWHTLVKSKDVIGLAAYGFLFASHTLWALISVRLATTRLLNSKSNDNKIRVSRSNVKTYLNSQHMVSYLLPI